jgi:hypothetical protein
MSFIAGSSERSAFQGDMKDSALVWIVRLGRTSLSHPWRGALVFVGYEEPRDGFDGEL